MLWRTFTATREHYYSMLNFVMKEAEKSDVPDKLQSFLELGFEEAVANIINYAYPEKDTGKIAIRAYREAEHFFIELKDFGIPFNPLLRQESAEMPADLQTAKVGGLGISLMRRIFDKMTYHFERVDNFSCNHLILGMKLSECGEDFL